MKSCQTHCQRDGGNALYPPRQNANSYQFDGWVAAYSTGNEPYGCRTPALELGTGERRVWLVDLSPPASIVEYPTFGNEGAMGLGLRLPLTPSISELRGRKLF